MWSSTPLGQFALVCCFLFPASNLLATGTKPRLPIEGRVVDATSGKVIAGARLSAGRHSALSGPDGRFEIGLPPGRWTLQVSAPNHLDQAVVVDVSDAPAAPLEVALVQQARFREELVVSADVANEAPATLPVRPAAVLGTAGSLDNVFRTLQTLPGVAGTDEFGSRLAVRGGTPDQNLTIMDGVEIHNPYRLFGITSAFNPETVERFELNAGGFGARYGDRLSSLLVVQNRDGNETRAISGSSSMSITDGNLIVEGKLPGTRAGAATFPARTAQLSRGWTSTGTWACGTSRCARRSRSRFRPGTGSIPGSRCTVCARASASRSRWTATMPRRTDPVSMVAPACRTRWTARGAQTGGGAWIEDRFQLSEAAEIVSGLRLDWSGVNGRATLSPRLSATWRLSEGTRLKAAEGLYTQSPGYEKLIQSDFFVDLSDAGRLDLDSERAVHAVIGLERDLAPGLLGSVEVYYKGFDRLNLGRLEAEGGTPGAPRSIRLPVGAAVEHPDRAADHEHPGQRRQRTGLRVRGLPGEEPFGPEPPLGMGLVQPWQSRARGVRSPLPFRV